VRPRPDADGRYGRVQAINVETKKTVWIDRQRAPVTAATLTTAGGVVFAGYLDRMFRALDAATGTPLWSTRLNDAPSSPPITYSANGQQYVAVTVGPGGYQSLSYGALVPEIQNPTDRATMLWVFEAPALKAAMPPSR
jgi:alcohol dehydrogenase (cytochrome c)